MKRRDFVQLLSTGIAAGSTGSLSIPGIIENNIKKITILHTNDWHSRIEPFPMDGSRNEGLGGASKRAALIKKIREAEENVLLFDSGDIFQGTPYFNFYLGELEFKLMSAMKYDAATIGNHDFDGGLESLAHQMSHADFEFLCANYSFDQKELAERVKPYMILNKGGLKVGVFGVGIELDGLVPKKLFGDTIYRDPIPEANKIADYLKTEAKCDLVVCLSHLGYRYDSVKVSDVVLARRSRNIDIILGGHTHTFMKNAAREINEIGNEVLINQVGWAGILLGRIDIYLERRSGWKWRKAEAVEIG
jgi:5'-nucleotidase